MFSVNTLNFTFEHLHTVEVVGSNPISPTNFLLSLPFITISPDFGAFLLGICYLVCPQ